MLLQLAKSPIAQAAMLVRKPSNDVYEAFVNPEITSKFWFTKSTGRLEVGQRIRWEWEMYGATTDLEVKLLDPGRRILIEWGLENQPTTVEWTFTSRGDQATFVEISNYGFAGDGDSVVRQALDSEAGFTLALAALKAYLEFGVNLNLIADRFPDNIINRQGTV